MSAVDWIKRYFIYRLSTRPAKQFLFMMLQHDGGLSKDKTIGLDLGCNKMENRPIFQAREYIGIDIDQAALNAGMKAYPETKSVIARIEESEKYPNGDFVVCVQVFHTKHFDHARSPEVLRTIVSKVNRDGVLLINFGAANLPYLEEIEKILRQHFSDVRRTTYDLGHSETVLSPLLAVFYMIWRPKGSLQGKKTYFRCEQKL